ncbi:hypothetical protein IAD21_06445 (plasmid) [Abditibacteriota bacterium]|nr:hypothetical protein IAD21_06445 [Abditibacteriota bacterium]
MRRLNSIPSGGAALASPQRASYTGEAIRVQSRGGIPARLEWRGRSVSVRKVEATWCVQGRWWLDEQRSGTRRRYFRLQVSFPCGRALCVEVFCSKKRDAPTSEWRVWRVAD